MRILLLSAYDAHSHQYWHRSLTDGLPEFDWTTLTLPDRNFYWRIRSNALAYTVKHSEVLSKAFDLVLATSMVDLCNLKGLNPTLATAKTLIYFHENQFCYPIVGRDTNLVNAQLTSLYSAMSADVLLFNSDFNRRTFFSGAKKLLSGMPDRINPACIDQLESRAFVLPVPVKAPGFLPGERPARNNKNVEPLHIVWNHRWEYDKQPEVFFRVMERLKTNGASFRLHVMGQSFRQIPPCFERGKDALAEHIDTWGYQPRAAYTAVLDKADIVISTAKHDFQGIGVIEAMQRGCIAIVPDSLVYPEYVPNRHRYSVGSSDTAKTDVMELNLYTMLAGILDSENSQSAVLDLSPAEIAREVRHFDVNELLPRYRELMTEFANTATSQLLGNDRFLR